MGIRRAALTVLLLAACNRGGTPPLETNAIVTPGHRVVRNVSRAPARPLTAELFRATRPAIAPRVAVVPAPVPAPVAARGSVRLQEPAVVMSAPAADAPELGVLAMGTRIAAATEVKNAGCRSGWIPVQPRGFVCARVRADGRAPTETILPRLAKGALIPGTYGKIRSQDALFFPTVAAAENGVGGQAISSSLTVRRRGLVRAGGKPFWKTRHGLIAADAVRRYRGSRFAGVELEGELAQPVAWTIGNGDRFSVGVKRSPSRRGRAVRRVGLRERFTVLATSDDGRFVQVGEEEWLPRAEVRIAAKTEAPQGIGPTERWLDIDLDQQTLVAYEGTTPVYATLISTGKVLHRTPTGTFRISRKVASRTMNSMSDAKESYSVDEVPWTAYFAKGYALHAAFWHQGFGRTRSHGCVNLAPKDARRLYDWMTPAAAPGWREVFGNEEQPGSVVRIRNRKNAEPAWKGYAAKLAPEAAVAKATG